MGTTRGHDVPYEGYNCCLPRGCDKPHIMRMDFHRTSDVILFYVDDELLFATENEQWEAMKLAAQTET